MKPRRIKLVVFDLDGTLTDVASIWEHLHERLGTWKVGRVSARLFREGKITYEDWAELDSACWADLPVSKVEAIIDEIAYAKGAREAFAELKRQGFIIGIVSAGLDILAERAKRDLGADIAISNELEVSGSKLTGGVKVRVSIYNKGQVVEAISRGLGIDMSEVAVVGDSVYDMPEGVGLRIAFNPKGEDAVKAADVVVRSDDLREVLRCISQFRYVP